MTDDAREISRLTPALRRYAQVLSRDAAEAEDLVQETFLRAHERRAGFRRGGLRPWLFSILHNLFIDRRRARGAEARREAEFAALQAGAAADGEESLRLAQAHG